jgi:hypothetical protein
MTDVDTASGAQGAGALRSGSLDIIMRPVNGWLSSRIRKIAADAESAKSPRAAMVVDIIISEQAEARKDEGEPKDQYHEEGQRDRPARIGE